MPVDGLQRRIATLLRDNGSKRSFVGGSRVFNTTFPRRSEDIDIFAHVPIAELAARDVAVLRGAGLTVDVNEAFYGFSIEALVEDGREATKIEWNEADRDRFFPVVVDPTFGWVMHRADLAVQKLIAAASRRKPRDAVDVALIDHLYAPLALLAIGAPAKLGRISPIAILDRVLQNAIGHPMADYEALDLDHPAMPFEIGTIKTVLADRLTAAQRIILEQCPTASAGTIYTDLDTGLLGLPTPENLKRLQPRTLSEHGAFASIGTTDIVPSEWRTKDPYERL